MRKSFLYILCFVAVCQLIGCGGGEEQRRQLAELEEQNHSGQPMLNDTLAETLVAYFDRHGNANERMRAKYILGRTYADMGELPRASSSLTKCYKTPEHLFRLSPPIAFFVSL